MGGREKLATPEDFIMPSSLRMTAKLEQGFRQLDDFAARIRAIAVPRALNTLNAQGHTAAERAIADEYKVSAKTMAPYTTTQAATTSNLEASVTVKGKGFPLSAFKPVQTTNGVAVTIKGKRLVIPHAFMIARFGQHVFARGAYGGKGNVKPTGETFGRFVYGRGRLPISELFTFGPAEAAGNPRVADAYNDRVEEQAAAVLAREIKAVARGF